MDEKNLETLWITPLLATGSGAALEGVRKHQGSMALYQNCEQFTNGSSL